MNEEEIITKKYFKIGEAAEIIGVPASTLRFWEKNFPQIKPMKNKKGDRIYASKDIEVLKEIHYLSHNKGVRLANVSKKVSRNPVPADARVYLIQQLREFKDKLLKLKDCFTDKLLLFLGQVDSQFNKWGTVKVLEVQVEHVVIPLENVKGLSFFQTDLDFEIFAQKVERRCCEVKQLDEQRDNETA
jgi:DNA-binding transcriptional MerR regulator